MEREIKKNERLQMFSIKTDEIFVLPINKKIIEIVKLTDEVMS